MPAFPARTVAAAALAVAILGAPAAAPAQVPGETALTLPVGESAPVGPPPVRNAICDDPSVARLEDGPSGPVLRAVAPGTTRCSMTDAVSVRRLYRITVVPAPPATPAPPAAGS
jgi:hypothetical protein